MLWHFCRARKWVSEALDKTHVPREAEPEKGRVILRKPRLPPRRGYWRSTFRCSAIRKWMARLIAIGRSGIPLNAQLCTLVGKFVATSFMRSPILAKRSRFRRSSFSAQLRRKSGTIPIFKLPAL
jgi:hypothetical protein